MTYTFTYDGTNQPRWEKILTASNGENLSVSLVFENEEDRLLLNAEQVYEHMENMLQFVKDRTQEISLIKLEDPAPRTYYPVHGDYDKIEGIMREIQKWWNWAYYNDTFDTEEEPTDEDLT